MKRLFLATLVAFTAAAQPETPPPAGAPKPPSIPAVRRFELPNGVDVRLVPWGQIPRATVAVVTQTGGMDEGPSEVRLSELTVEAMKQGTATHDASELARIIAMMGGSLTAFADANRVTFTADVFGDSADEAVALLGEVVRSPRLPASELPRLKNDLQRNVAISRTFSEDMARATFAAAIFGDHPYGRYYPPEGAVEAFSIDQVRAFHQRNFGPARTAVYVVGQFDSAAVEHAVRGAFDGWSSHAAPAFQQPAASVRGGLHFVPRPDAVQSTIIIGTPAIAPSHPDAVGFALMNTLLGGSFTSRITQNIRERKGYTYSPRSTVSPLIGATMWDETADVTTNVTGAAIREILGEIERLGRETPPADEVQRMQNLAYGQFIRRIGTRPGIAEQLSLVDLHGLPEDYLSTWVGRLFAVTPSDVQRLARETLRRDALTIVVVGDRTQVLPQLREFGTVVE